MRYYHFTACFFIFGGDCFHVAFMILVPQPGIEPRPHEVELQSLNHWTGWEILVFFFFFFWMLTCISHLYKLDINPLSVIAFGNVFSHSVGCLFILLMFSFAVQKLLNLIRSYLFTVAFISFTLGDKAKKTLL